MLFVVVVGVVGVVVVDCCCCFGSSRPFSPFPSVERSTHPTLRFCTRFRTAWSSPSRSCTPGCGPSTHPSGRRSTSSTLCKKRSTSSASCKVTYPWYDSHMCMFSLNALSLSHSARVFVYVCCIVSSMHLCMCVRARSQVDLSQYNLPANPQTIPNPDIFDSNTLHFTWIDPAPGGSAYPYSLFYVYYEQYQYIRGVALQVGACVGVFVSVPMSVCLCRCLCRCVGVGACVGVSVCAMLVSSSLSDTSAHAIFLWLHGPRAAYLPSALCS